MRRFLADFLKALEAAVPPPEKAHHCITYAQYGSTIAGWQDKLALQVNCNGKFLCFFLEDSDFDRSPESLAIAVSVEVHKSLTDATQLGVAPGRYV